ncbi:hypothetical protein U1Q18_001590, partial [Sarracenia purpurea var. burkii]
HRLCRRKQSTANTQAPCLEEHASSATPTARRSAGEKATTTVAARGCDAAVYAPRNANSDADLDS